MVQLLASYPVGTLADRIGSLPVLVIGYVLGALTALGAVAAFWWQFDSIPVLALVFLAAGLYMTVQEALESTVTADMVAQDTLATSYGALGTVNGIAKLISSSAVGLLWTAVSPLLAFGLAAVLMAMGTLALRRVR